LQAILLAGEGADVRIAIPAVNDCGELRRIKEILFEERLELRSAGNPLQDDVAIGVVLETPAALLGVRDICAEADFLLLDVDAVHRNVLGQVMGANRNRVGSADGYEVLHPFVLRALGKVVAVARELGRPLAVFGFSFRQTANIALLFGSGLSSFCVAPTALRAFLDAARSVDAESATSLVRAARGASSKEQMLGRLDKHPSA